MGGAGAAQGIGGVEQGGAGGADVVHEQQVPRHGGAGQGLEAAGRVLEARPARERALVAGARAGEGGRHGQVQLLCQAARQQLRVVEAAPPARGGRGRHEHHRLRPPGGRVGARHEAGQGLGQAALSLVLVRAHDPRGRLAERDGARAPVVGHPVAPGAPEHHGVALAALYPPERRPAHRAGTPPIQIGQGASAGVAQHLAGRVAHGAARGPQRLRQGLGGTADVEARSVDCEGHITSIAPQPCPPTVFPPSPSRPGLARTWRGHRPRLADPPCGPCPSVVRILRRRARPAPILHTGFPCATPTPARLFSRTFRGQGRALSDASGDSCRAILRAALPGVFPIC